MWYLMTLLLFGNSTRWHKNVHIIIVVVLCLSLCQSAALLKKLLPTFKISDWGVARDKKQSTVSFGRHAVDHKYLHFI